VENGSRLAVAALESSLEYVAERQGWCDETAEHSYACISQGEYLGTEVAIKEVLPNNTYDVEKYFERECVLMKWVLVGCDGTGERLAILTSLSMFHREARHPNIVQYIGLTKSPGVTGRIYIISEFVGGNLRSYIADVRALPWFYVLSPKWKLTRHLSRCTENQAVRLAASGQLRHGHCPSGSVLACSELPAPRSQGRKPSHYCKQSYQGL
jgi:hypothetical protein